MDLIVTQIQITGGPGRHYPGDPTVFLLPERLFAERVADQIFNEPDLTEVRKEYNIVTQFAQIDDVGVVILVQMIKQSDGTPLDISAATDLSIVIGYPGGVREIKTALLYTDGLDGKMYYVTEVDVLAIPGDYQIQGKAVIGSDVFYSEPELFTVKDNIEPGTPPPGPDPHVGTFINANLVAGVFTITHDKSLSPPYTVNVIIFDNNGHQIVPDAITGHANTVDITLTSFAPLLGTWGYVYV